MKRERERSCETCKYHRIDGGPAHEPLPFCTLHAYRGEFTPCEDFKEQTSLPFDKKAAIGCIAVLAALLVLLAFTVPAVGNFIRSIWSRLLGLFS